MDYHLYFLRAGHIVHRVDLECGDDEEAVATVREHADGRAMELWQAARLVKQFPASSTPPSTPPFAPGRG